MPLTVLAVADQVDGRLYDHFDVKRWRDIDLVLSCGDLPPYYLDFLCSSLDVPVLYVRGNHDGNFPAADYCGCTNLHGQIVECKGVRVAGIEGSFRYNQGACQYSEGQMRRIAARMQVRARLFGAPDILLTHAPPAGCHDDSDLCHRGFDAFNFLIQQWQPAYHVHGHMHLYEPRETQTTVGVTTVLNAFPFQRIEIPLGHERQPAPKRISASSQMSVEGARTTAAIEVRSRSRRSVRSFFAADTRRTS